MYLDNLFYELPQQAQLVLPTSVLDMFAWIGCVTSGDLRFNRCINLIDIPSQFQLTCVDLQSFTLIPLLLLPKMVSPDLLISFLMKKHERSSL